MDTCTIDDLFRHLTGEKIMAKPVKKKHEDAAEDKKLIKKIVKKEEKKMKGSMKKGCK